MKALFIGGTGTISMAITKLIANDSNWELYLINRGSRKEEIPSNVKLINLDINDEDKVKEAIKDLSFDVVGEFIAYNIEQIQRDIRLFSNKTKQYIFISSASAYLKPVSNYVITEKTKLENPYWEYSRNKIACEELLIKEYRENGFPVTIVRPSHTYDNRKVPVGIHGRNGSFQVIKRMMEGKRILVHGDGTTLWTMTNSKDFAKGYIGLMGNRLTIGETYHITSDESLTWNQIYLTIAEVLGVEYKPYYVSSQYLVDVAPFELLGNLLGDKANTVVFDNSKIKRIVPGLTMDISYKQGVEETIANVLSNPSLQKEDTEFDLWCDKVIDTLENAKKIIKK